MSEYLENFKRRIKKEKVNSWKRLQRWEYNGVIYTYIDEIQVKNPVTREWDVAVLYNDEVGNMYAREINEFYQRFKQVNI